MVKYDTVLADTNVLNSLKTVLTDHFGKGGEAWRLVPVGNGITRIEVGAGDIYVHPGDIVHVKNTSILIAVGANHVSH